MKNTFRLVSPVFVLVCVWLPVMAASGSVIAEEILIGEYGSLTGDHATFGISTKNGIDMAVDEINAAGGVLGKKVRVIVEDDQGQAEEAQTVVTKLITNDKVVAVLGEVASSRQSCGRAGRAAERHPDDQPVLHESEGDPKGRLHLPSLLHRSVPGLVMAKFATNTLKLKKVAILRDIKNDYSVGLADAFIENFKKMGGTIVGDESYSDGDTDFNAQLTSIKAKNPQAIFVPGYYTEVGLIARQAKKLGITSRCLAGTAGTRRADRDRRRGSGRVVLFEPLFGGRSQPGSSRSFLRTTRRGSTPFRMRSEDWATTRRWCCSTRSSAPTRPTARRFATRSPRPRISPESPE